MRIVNCVFNVFRCRRGSAPWQGKWRHVLCICMYVCMYVHIAIGVTIRYDRYICRHSRTLEFDLNPLLLTGPGFRRDHALLQ
jgi:hypothetical protein